MSKYTPDRVARAADLIEAVYPDERMAVDMLRAYAATLKAAQGGVTEAMVEALRPFANAYRRLRHYGDNPTDETPLYAYAGEGHPLYELLNGEHGERLTVQTLGEAAAALEAALSAEPAAQGDAVALNVRHPKCHEAANAFWNYWNANGETHKRGYYESTWGAINAALRMVGVRPHDYGDAPPPDGSSPRYDDAAPPAQPAERVPEGWVPITALRDLYRAYVRTLEAGRDRITSLGGSCDSVEDMELCDPALSVARRAMLAASPAPSPARVDGEKSHG